MKKLLTIVALILAMTVPVVAQTTGTISGTAKNEAVKPYADYTVRARDIDKGATWSDSTLADDGTFALTGLRTDQKFIVELVRKDGKVVCTEGPYTQKTDVNIECGKKAAWLVLAAAGAAGVTALGVTGSPTTKPTPGVTQFGAVSASK